MKISSISFQFCKVRQYWFNPTAYVTSNKSYHRAKNSLWVAVWHSIFYSAPAITLEWRNHGHMASQITSISSVSSTVYWGADQRKHLSSASLAFVRAIHRWPVNSPHKRPVTRKMLPFDDVIMLLLSVNFLHLSISLSHIELYTSGSVIYVLTN